ncbi:MAG: hypothetical protein C0614_12930 [Desulfuromonas sp.]|nr:MAG: hypothetical protein C0614_12930 [Desulfuromonas sp.]
MTLSPDNFKAVLFDLDGVLTMTMPLHAACWKCMFDDYLRQRAQSGHEKFRPFEIASDYHQHVDGKLRQDGVRSFLTSRGIELPEGEPDDPPERETVHGLGNRKNLMVNQAIASEGVEVIHGSVEMARHLRTRGVRTAVVSASKNCRMVLEVSGIESLFEVVVDGTLAARLGLPGKPSPETFLEAARQLQVEPAQAVVIEDAISGVQAGRAGGFGLVVGIDHHDQPQALLQAGADLVVKDLSELLVSMPTDSSEDPS